LLGVKDLVEKPKKVKTRRRMKLALTLTSRSTIIAATRAKVRGQTSPLRIERGTTEK